MTKKDKELLLKDLCARLPYEVNVEIKYSKEHGSSLRLAVCSEGMLALNANLLRLFQEEEIYLKPYLRSISSMTEEEQKELFQLMGNGNDVQRIDFYNSHHLDYRGLIEKGLALEATEGMYNIK